MHKLPVYERDHDLTPDQVEDLTKMKVGEIRVACSEEILMAILDRWMEAGICGIYVLIRQAANLTFVNPIEEDSAPILRGVRNAVSSASLSRAMFHEYVGESVDRAIVSDSAAKTAELRSLKGKKLLDQFATPTPDRMRFMVEFLTEGQRRDLSNMLYVKLGNSPRPIRTDIDFPLEQDATLKQRWGWLHWLINCRDLHRQEARDLLGGVPRFAVLFNGDRMAKKRITGEMVDPLGPLWVKPWLALARELNKKGLPIQDPESKNRLAKSLGVSRSTIQRYLDEDIQQTITPDGEGGVDVKWDMTALLKAIDAAERKKRD